MIKLKFAYKKISKLCIHAFESCQCVCVFNKYMILQDTLLIPTSSHCAIHCYPSLHPSPAGAALPQPVPLLHRQHLPAEPHAGDPVLRHALLRPQRLQCGSRWLLGHWSFIHAGHCAGGDGYRKCSDSSSNKIIAMIVIRL